MTRWLPWLFCLLVACDGRQAPSPPVEQRPDGGVQAECHDGSMHCCEVNPDSEGCLGSEPVWWWLLIFNGMNQ